MDGARTVRGHQVRLHAIGKQSQVETDQPHIVVSGIHDSRYRPRGAGGCGDAVNVCEQILMREHDALGEPVEPEEN